MSSRFFPFALGTQQQRSAHLQLLRPGRDLALAAEQAEDVVPIDQQLADAFNSNNAVLAYVLSITASTLPVLSPLPSPDWYTPFVTRFSDAKVHAMAWQNTVTPGLVAIPQGIVNYALLFNMNMGNINQAMTVLQQDPGNAQAKQVVVNGLQSLLSGISGQLATATTFQGEVNTFASNLTADAAAMQDAINQAVSQEGVDEKKIAKLTADIAALHDQIATWQVVVTASAIGAGVGFWAGAVIAIFSFGAGLAFGIISAAAGIATLIAAEVKIQQLSAKIAEDQRDMDSLNQQVAALKVLEQNLQTLIDLSGEASKQVDLIIRAWQQMEAEITAVINDLNQAQSDLSSLNIPALQGDLNRASADWQTLQSFASTMAGIRYNQAAPPTATLPTTEAAA